MPNLGSVNQIYVGNFYQWIQAKSLIFRLLVGNSSLIISDFGLGGSRSFIFLHPLDSMLLCLAFSFQVNEYIINAVWWEHLLYPSPPSPFITSSPSNLK